MKITKSVPWISHNNLRYEKSIVGTGGNRGLEFAEGRDGSRSQICKVFHGGKRSRVCKEKSAKDVMPQWFYRLGQDYEASV